MQSNVGVIVYESAGFSMTELGKILIVFGLVLLVAGAVLMVLGLRRGLHSFAAPRLEPEATLIPHLTSTCLCR